MAFGKSNSNESNWISFSDIMTGLMVIFMFIAISYLVEAQKNQQERDIIFEEFKATKEQLYAELEKEFKDDFKDWEVELDKDLSIKFTNPDVLFPSGKSEITPNFANILNDFLPRYFDILLQLKYKDKIAEIRIEGHTDMVPVSNSDIPYIGNLELSQQRSTSVMKYLISSDYYKSLEENRRWWLLFNLTANGLSYGRTVDSNKKFTYISKNKVNNEFSRRVEFRIITSSENLVERVLEEIEK